jgi:hypothetical protein
MNLELKSFFETHLCTIISLFRPTFTCGPITNFVSSNGTSVPPAKEPKGHKVSQDPVQSVGAQL